MTFGERIRNLRQAKGLTQEELAEASKVSRVSIGFYERENRVPPVDIALAIAKVLNTSVEYIMTGHLALDGPTAEDEQDEFETFVGELEKSGLSVTRADSATEKWLITNQESESEYILTDLEFMELMRAVIYDAEARRELYIKNRLKAEFS